MTQPPATTRPRTILYVAATDAAASDGAATLENVDSGPERSVRPATTVERVRNWAPAVDCVVFGETPTTAAGSNLLEIADACGSTPLVLFSESTYAPPAARSTDGIDGYVRRDTDDAVAHLADEIEWVCNDRDATDSGLGDTREDEPIIAAGETSAATSGSTAPLLESFSELIACRDRDRFFELLVEAVADSLEREYCWLSTVHFGDFTPQATASAVPDDDLGTMARSGQLGDALGTNEAIRFDEIGDDDGPEPPLEGVESLCCVPVGTVGVLQVAADEPAAFDERDCDLLESWGAIAARFLERADAEAANESERDRLRAARDRLLETRDRLAEERDAVAADRDRIATERDRYRTLFENVPEPAIRYEIDDGQPIVRTINDTFTEVFGTDPESVVDGVVDEDTVPPGLEHRRATLLESLRSGERRQLVCRRETVDGVREFLLTLVPLEANVDGNRGSTAVDSGSDGDPETSTGDGKPDARNSEGMIVYSDVTEANRRERRLAAAESRLETIADLVDDDVRSPLNVARGYLELAAETGDREHFAEVDDAQERLRELIDQIVSIARRDAVVVETEPVAIHDVARRAWIAVETGDARLVTRKPEDRVLEADKTRLRELFEHLFQAVLDDAVESNDDHTADGDDEIEVGNSAGREETTVVSVGSTDDGFYVARHAPETDAEAVDSGLEANPVPDRLAAADGTGFGIGTVERIADAHGWNLGVAEDDSRVAFAFRGVDSRDDE
ncbi:sensor histidine kinase [Natrinema halophilum]|uniref:histidine kinase n=1 Tax=Natrinema halophilum TaxID=1699371 RepID=A0A7D5GLE1_9EURY|nr:GAF domain-containing sensor histidine kinase [Natrinema halophilum]QLG49790.1 GAF domain-containing sensor histidine kinase [Natrinema halophilum]